MDFSLPIISEEVNNTYIYFPDPWPKKRHHKNRLIQLDFLHTLFDIQKKGSFLEFKSDNLEYFDWTVERLKRSPYKIERLTNDLHNSEWSQENFQTHFEKLWTSKGIKTNLVRCYKH
jgi:tRNA (guanine-N7-)-methyltransferase